MDCSLAEELLPEFVDGGLAAAEAEALAAHLAACPACAKLYAAHRAIADGLARTSPVAAPAGFEARLLAAIARDRLGELLAPSWVGQTAAVAAVAAAAVPAYLELARWWWGQGGPQAARLWADLLPASVRHGARLAVDQQALRGLLAGALGRSAGWLARPLPLPAIPLPIPPLCLAGLAIAVGVWLWYASTPLFSLPLRPVGCRARRRSAGR